MTVGELLKIVQGISSSEMVVLADDGVTAWTPIRAYVVEVAELPGKWGAEYQRLDRVNPKEAKKRCVALVLD